MKYPIANIFLSALLLVTGLVACTHASDTPDSDITKSSEQEISVTKFMLPQEQVAYAQNELAQRLGVPVQNISLPSVHAVVWRSGALGCPEPGKVYTQALESGVLIVFNYNDSLYRYHAVQNGEPFYCPAEWAEPQSAAPSEI